MLLAHEQHIRVHSLISLSLPMVLYNSIFILSLALFYLHFITFFIFFYFYPFSFYIFRIYYIFFHFYNIFISFILCNLFIFSFIRRLFSIYFLYIKKQCFHFTNNSLVDYPVAAHNKPTHSNYNVLRNLTHLI